MASNLGPGVSRVLDPNGREFLEVILQQGKPPMDAEFNLLQEIAADFSRTAVLRGTPSGWLGNETSTMADYITNSQWSNWFKFGSQRTGEKQAIMWAVVNGWLVPVTSTRTGTPPGAPNDVDAWNLIALDPPPANSGDFRTDFVFLEVWKARVAPNPSSTNKPSSSGIFKYGNVESGNTYLADDMVDPALGFETSQRVQLQYRIRVVKGLLGLSSYPDGFDPSVVKAKGAYDPTNPDTVTAYTYSNMRQELGDSGLWRAGDGTANNLNTVDGYVYAIPLCGVFRRNAVVWTGDPSPNLNGGFNRNPTAVDRSGVKTFSTIPSLNAAMTASSTTLTLASVANIPLPLTPLTPVYIQIGDEIMTYTSITGTTMSGLVRGLAGTVAEPHPLGSTITPVAGRPDGLYSDQVAQTDILDLRHLVNPNGFDYNALLRSNFDKLLRGELRSNWKRAGNSTQQGTFVAYQDKVTGGGVALGVTKLDAPDNIRMIFSDASVVQPVELVVAPNTNAPPALLSAPWALTLTANRTSAAPGVAQFEPGTVIQIPVAQLKAGLPGGDSDQVRWCNEAPYEVKIRIDGDTDPLTPAVYTVTPATLTSGTDLVITLGGGFPITGKQLYITLHVMYGAGRGVSRRPDALHSVSLLSPTVNLMHTAAQFPSNNYRLSTGHVVQWSKFRYETGFDGPPVTAESYLDHGSKTLVLQPFRLMDWPDNFITIEGTAANLRPTPFFTPAGLAGATGNQLQDVTGTNLAAAGVMVGDAVVITAGVRTGRFTITAITTTVNPNDTLVLDRPCGNTGSASYLVYKAQGLMPLLKRDGVTAKWTTTDPLQLFAGTTDTTAATKNLYVSLPGHLIPQNGAVHVPILPVDTTSFDEGVNFFFNSLKGASPQANSDRNYVPYSNGTFSYAVFTTLDLNPPGTNPAPYNAAISYSGNNYAGIRQFTDTTGSGRQGLQLPPFYGVTRLFGVYEANDYKINGSPFDSSTRERTGSLTAATNLLRQNVVGPTFWIETDDDGDSTFVLNAAAIDISKSPAPIANFAAGNYIIEASIFGFDRDTFRPDPTLNRREVRIVLTRATPSSGMRQQANDLVTRANNVNIAIAGPVGILPGPMTAGDSALVNFSRTPYGGDAWGTQTNNIDISYNPGPLQTGVAYQIASTQINESALTRPNQKPLEILAALNFATTAGTGRIGGAPNLNSPLGNAGYEDISQSGPTPYPPLTSLDPRPNFFTGGLAGEPQSSNYLSKYNGCTERLPLGALRRDKDFRAVFFSNLQPGHTQVHQNMSLGYFGGLATNSTLDATSLVALADASVEPGNVMVHVDGEQGNYALLTNYRTFRGGSAFLASGDNPGGSFSPGFVGSSNLTNGVSNVLAGTAYLVRNAPTLKGATEVSAGGELMLVVATQFQDTFGTVGPAPQVVDLSTNGMAEGNAAVDLYRIEGHPLVRDNIRANVDPSTLALTRRPPAP